MSARRCFVRKVGAGRISNRAGDQILTMLDEFEGQYRASLGEDAGGRQAALDAAAAAEEEAARKADLVNRSIVAQVKTLKRVQNYGDVVNGLRRAGQAPLALRKDRAAVALPALRAMLARDIHDVHNGFENVDMLARDIRGRAHSMMTDAIELLRPKYAGTTTSKATELEFLRAAYGATQVSADARAAYEGFNRANDGLADQFIAEGGQLVKRKDWRLPNPRLDEAKVKAKGPEQFRQLVLDNLDREATLDWRTGKRMADARLEQLVDESWHAFEAFHAEGEPSAAFSGRPMLARSRELPRVFVWKSAEAWLKIAEELSAHSSPFEAAMGHIASTSRDVALMRVLGPNPDAWLRFATDLIERERSTRTMTGAELGGDQVKAVAWNRGVEDKAKKHALELRDVFEEVTGRNRIPGNSAIAARVGDFRSLLVGSQMGSAVISSLTDTVTQQMTARFNGLPVMRVLARTIKSFGERHTEIHGAQLGLVADTLAHVAGNDDQILGQTIRSGRAAKIGTAVIRASGLRLWTAKGRAAFAMEWMAFMARHAEDEFATLPANMREAFGRYGMAAPEWDLIRATAPYEPRTNALFLRPMDVAHLPTGEKLMRLLNTEMDHAVVEQDPIARAWMIGDSKAGTLSGEIRRGGTMYRSFSASFVTLHFNRAVARGFDGRRLSHAALTMLYMTALGALAMEAKQVKAGRDPFELDPTTGFGARAWLAAVLQGGGLGVFGDLVNAVGQGRPGSNTLAALTAGPMISAAEDVKNFVVSAGKHIAAGEPGALAGDALYLFGKYAPGNNLWYGQLAFDREILDQLQLMADPKTPERFRRIERSAAENYGQDFWWRPGETAPARMPAFPQ